MGRILTTIVLLYIQLQGPKLTFLGRRLLATEIWFQSPYAIKFGCQKSVNKFLSAQRKTNRWTTLVANFSFENQNKENTFVAAMVIFALTNKIKYKQPRWLFIHLSLKNHVEQIKYWPYMQFRSTAKCFKSTLHVYNLSCAWPKNCCLVLCSVFKTIFCFLSRGTRDNRRFTMKRTRPQPCSISCSSLLNSPHYVCYEKRQKKHGNKALHWS